MLFEWPLSFKEKVFTNMHFLVAWLYILISLSLFYQLMSVKNDGTIEMCQIGLKMCDFENLMKVI